MGAGKSWPWDQFFIIIFDFMMIAYKVVIAEIIVNFFLLGIRKVINRSGWKKIIFRAIFIVLLTNSILILCAKFFILNMIGR